MPALAPLMALDRAPPQPGLALDRSSVRTYDKAGHMHVAASPISKANTRRYLGSEIPGAEALGLIPTKAYTMLLHPDELAKAAGTFSGKPLLSVHRPQMAADYDPEMVIGSIGDASWTPPYLTAPLTVWCEQSIDAIESGALRELSSGFFYTPDMTPGEYEGAAYDGVMRDIIGNHVAIVETGRAGSDVMVMDHKPKELQMKPLSRKAALVKGVLTAGLAPILAQDAKVDTTSLVRAITAKNWASTKPKLIAGLRRAVPEGKLAQDASLDDLIELIDKLEDVADELTDDMPAVAADPVDPVDPVAEDEDDKDEKPKADVVEKPAMDAAIAAAVNKARADAAAIRQAERDVAPFIGEVTTAMDSAADYYKLALDHLKVDVGGVPPVAYGALLRALPKPNAAPARIAQDAAAPADFAARWGRAEGQPRLRAV